MKKNWRKKTKTKRHKNRNHAQNAQTMAQKRHTTVKQAAKPRETPIYNAEMLNKCKPPTNNIQRQRKTYYVKQTIKQRETPIYNAEMLNKTKRNKQHSTTEKNIKTDINNEEKLAQKKQTNDKKHQLTQKC